jgi:hypothetical protein
MGKFAILLLVSVIAACSSGKRPNQPPRQEASPQPAASSNTEATGSAESASFQKWKNAQIIDAFKAAGLEAENPRPMSQPQDYGQIPMIDVEGTQFNMPSLGEDGIGHIYSFASEGEIEKMIKYYSDASTDNFSWVYVKDNILVQLDGRLDEEKAKQYEAAMGNIRP